MKRWIAPLIYLVILFSRYQTQFQAKANLDKMVGSEIRVVGRISSEPILQGTIQKLKVSNLEVVTSAYPKYEYGQKVAITGTLQRQVLGKWVSRFRLMYPRVETVQPDNVNAIGFDWKRGIYRFRKKIEGVYNQALPEPEASLLAGIVLGVKRSLPQEFWQSLQKTGTLHIVVASGYNITVVIGVTVGLLAGLLKRPVAILIGVLMAGGYTVMAGAEPAIVRAAIMGSIAFGAQILGREADGLRALGVAVAGMLLYSPQVVFDVGFQLSAMATLGLILVGPIINDLMTTWQDKFFSPRHRVRSDSKNLPLPSWFGEIRDSLSAQIMVWPIILINFGSISVFSLLVNGLILWLVPLVMSLGLLLAGVGLVSEWLAVRLGWLVYLPLTVMVRVVEWFGSKDWMSYQVDGVSGYWMVGYYLALVLIFLSWIRKREQRYNLPPVKV